jgi:hypothetical protein
MAADLWQLANGWELVDWSLNVGGEPPAPTPGGGGGGFTKPRLVDDNLSFPRARRMDDDEEAIAFALLVLV